LKKYYKVINEYDIIYTKIERKGMMSISYLSKKKYKNYTISISGILVYLALAFLLMGRVIDNTSAVNGIIAQLQMIISVGLVILLKKRAYAIPVTLNFFSLIGSILYIFRSDSFESLPGTLSYIAVIIIITIIFSYKKRLNYNIDMLVIKERRLRKLAYFDGLTDLLNRKTFIEELDVLIEFSKENDKRYYIIFMDIDDFKFINDTYGHYAGDIVLEKISARIKETVFEEDIIGRLGGDEIGIIIKKNLSKEEVILYLDNIMKVVTKEIKIEDQLVKTSVSMGVSIFPEHGNTSRDLLKNADLAMYESKKLGKKRVSFYSENKE